MSPSLPPEVWSMVCQQVFFLEVDEFFRRWRVRYTERNVGWVTTLRLVNRNFLAAASPYKFSTFCCYLRWKPSLDRLEEYVNSPNIFPYLKTLHFKEWTREKHRKLSADELANRHPGKVLLDISDVGLDRRLARIVSKLRVEQVSVWDLSLDCCRLLHRAFQEAHFLALRHLELHISKANVGDIDDYLPCGENVTSKIMPVFNKQSSAIKRIQIWRSKKSQLIPCSHLVQRLPVLREFILKDIHDSILPTLRFPRTLMELTLDCITTTTENLLSILQHCAPSLQSLSLYIIRLEQNQYDGCGWSDVLDQLKDMPQLYNVNRGNQLKLVKLCYTGPDLPVWTYYGELLSTKINDRLAWRSLKETAGAKGLLVTKNHYPDPSQWITIEEAELSASQNIDESLQKCFVQSEGQIRCFGDTSPPGPWGCRKIEFTRCQETRPLLDYEDPEVIIWWCTKHRRVFPNENQENS